MSNLITWRQHQRDTVLEELPPRRPNYHLIGSLLGTTFFWVVAGLVIVAVMP